MLKNSKTPVVIQARRSVSNEKELQEFEVEQLDGMFDQGTDADVVENLRSERAWKIQDAQRQVNEEWAASKSPPSGYPADGQPPAKAVETVVSPTPPTAKEIADQNERVKKMLADRQAAKAAEVKAAIDRLDAEKAKTAKDDSDRKQQREREAAAEREKAAQNRLRTGNPLKGEARKKWLRELVKDFPGTSAAELAQYELDRK